MSWNPWQLQVFSISENQIYEMPYLLKNIEEQE